MLRRFWACVGCWRCRPCSLWRMWCVHSHEPDDGTDPANQRFAPRPAMWQDLESFDIVGTFDALQYPAVLIIHLLHDRCVTAISPDQVQTTLAIVQTMFNVLKQFLQSQDTFCTTLDARAMNHDQQCQLQNTHNQVPFSVRRLLMYIHAAFFPAFRGFDAFAVNHGGTRLLIPSSFLMYLLYQILIGLFPQSFALPAPIIVVHGTPGRKIDRQHPPLVASAVHIQDSVDYLPFFSFLRTPKSGAGKEFRYLLPFGILQVSRVWVNLVILQSYPTIFKHSLSK